MVSRHIRQVSSTKNQFSQSPTPTAATTVWVQEMEQSVIFH